MQLGTANEPSADTGQFIAALDALVATMHETAENAAWAAGRAEGIRDRLRCGMSARDIIENEDGPLLPELVTSMLRGLLEAGSRLRRHEAHALHAEGLSMDAIGQLFGVTRQRVSALLRSSIDEPATWWGDQT